MKMLMTQVPREIHEVFTFLIAKTARPGEPRSASSAPVPMTIDGKAIHKPMAVDSSNGWPRKPLMAAIA